MCEYTVNMLSWSATPCNDAIVVITIWQIKKTDRMSNFSKIMLKVSAWVLARAQE